jgi:hypothetical protein
MVLETSVLSTFNHLTRLYGPQFVPKLLHVCTADITVIIKYVKFCNCKTFEGPVDN